MPGQEQANLSSITFNSPRPSTSKSFESDEISIVQEVHGHGHAKFAAESARKFLKRMMEEDEEDIDDEPIVAEDDLEQKVSKEIDRYI